ncbi:MAG: Lrp/AsnC family transcriptional regulator [Candidatus Bathyarchaeia archaeon]
MAEYDLDQKDIEILKILSADAKLTTKEVARRLQSPVSTVFSRIKRLEKEGIIKKYVALLDPRKFGKETIAFVLVSFSTQGQSSISQREVAKRIAEFPEVQEAHIITGDWDILLKVRVSNVEELGNFVVDKLRSIRGISKTVTSLVLSTEKEEQVVLP